MRSTVMKWGMRIALGVVALVVLWIGVVFTLVGEMDTTPNLDFGFVTHQWSSLKSMVGIPAIPAGNMPAAPDCPGESEEHYEAADNHKILIGMSPCLVRAAWGEPDMVADDTAADRASERWVYDHREISFQDDRVITIQDATN